MKEWYFNDSQQMNDWEFCKKGPCEWNKYMGLEPEIHGGFIRLNCVKDGDTYKTAGIQTKELLGDGTVEIKARFRGGDSSWPALWLINERADKYYEIDIAEYFGDNDKVKSGLFMPKHINGTLNKLKRLFRPKENTKINKNDWNIFQCQWNADAIKIAINGKVILTYKNNGKEDSYPQTEDYRKFNLILSMQYGHGKPKPSQLPLYMDVEHVLYIEK